MPVTYAWHSHLQYFGRAMLRAPLHFALHPHRYASGRVAAHPAHFVAWWMDAAVGTGNGIAFEVDDIEPSVASLRSAGIAVDAIYESAMCKSTSLRDPEGNRITLHEMSAGRRV